MSVMQGVHLKMDVLLQMKHALWENITGATRLAGEINAGMTADGMGAAMSEQIVWAG